MEVNGIQGEIGDLEQRNAQSGFATFAGISYRGEGRCRQEGDILQKPFGLAIFMAAVRGTLNRD